MNRPIKILFGVVLLVFLVLIGNLLSNWVTSWFDFRITPLNEHKFHWVLMSSMIAYTLLMAIPFVPGAEIGFAVMMVVGPKVAPLVYGCTLISLLLSFSIGRFIPDRVLIDLFQRAGFTRVVSLLEELTHLDSQQRLQLIVSRSPIRLVPFLLRFRYIALLLAINMPGSIVIGGGGGIAMVAGLSRLFNFPYFVITSAIAIAPFPVLLALFGEYFGNWSIK